MSNDANRHVIGRHGNVTKCGNIYGIVHVKYSSTWPSIGLPSTVIPIQTTNLDQSGHVMHNVLFVSSQVFKPSSPTSHHEEQVMSRSIITTRLWR